MIAYLLFIFFFNCFAIIAINRATEYESFNDEVIPGSESGFWFIRFYSIKIFGEQLSKTTCTCPKCMATLWAIPGYIYFLHFYADWQMMWIAFYPFYWFGLSTVSYVTSLLISRLEN